MHNHQKRDDSYNFGKKKGHVIVHSKTWLDPTLRRDTNFVYKMTFMDEKLMAKIVIFIHRVVLLLEFCKSE